MQIEMTFELPFSWCKICQAFDPDCVSYYDETGRSTEIRRCGNAQACELAEKARQTMSGTAVCNDG